MRASLAAALAAVALAAGCGGGGGRHAATATTPTGSFLAPSPANSAVSGPLGAGADEVWLFSPRRARPRALVILLHGSGDVDPNANMRPWIDHLTGRGDAVLYPRYELDRQHADRGHVVQHLLNGVHRGVAALDAGRLPVVVVGYSWGARLAMDYAAVAAPLHDPAPSAVLSVFPSPTAMGDQFGNFKHLDRRLRVVLLVGDRDRDVGDLGAKEILKELQAAGFPPGNIEARLVRSRNGFVADHLSVLNVSRDVVQRYWAPADELVRQARAGS